jgi:hypothetical protein
MMLSRSTHRVDGVPSSTFDATSVSLAADLREDILGGWAPDVAAGVDYEAYEAGGDRVASYVAFRLDVPRPGGHVSRVRILHPVWHMALHRAVVPLREYADRILSPGVFGYRFGALAERRYADDWRAFCDFVTRQADEHALIVVSDVKAFFASTSWSMALAATEVIGDRHVTQSLANVAAALERGAVTRLPTGYSDARLLANYVLAAAEAGFAFPFARWVDDYRLFVDDQEQARAAVASMDRGLSALRLSRNVAKTSVLPSNEALEKHHQTLASVYHPERDSTEVIAERLRDVFELAASDPVGHRRQLRFVLPRLGDQGDDIAVRFALEGLADLPWEAPRLVGYLARFVETHDLVVDVNALVADAARDGDAWRMSRLAPLAAKVRISRQTARALETGHRAFVGTPAWGLVLRLLALAGQTTVVRRVIDGPTPDARAAIVAARDVDLPLPGRLRRAEPALASVVDDGVAPPLPTDSLL